MALVYKNTLLPQFVCPFYLSEVIILISFTSVFFYDVFIRNFFRKR